MAESRWRSDESSMAMGNLDRLEFGERASSENTWESSFYSRLPYEIFVRCGRRWGVGVAESKREAYLWNFARILCDDILIVKVGNQQFVFWIMASTACFVIVSRNDIPIYEAEVGSKEEAAHLHQFILHAALDIVQDLAWTTSAMFLKSVDRFNDLVVSVYVTAGHTRLMLLHDSRNEDGIKSFFQDVHELYLKVTLLITFVPLLM
ncbi:Trafficking protein particle complex subunit 2 [Ananas comosus]|uniref:Trafficking protein particle complex subunit 2 n=1 Tax=Ananas comosus TaxID=4615 RepID=A0A199UV19_ANACO|nr:Trafficking protein particle complex subunit 2 [Ananas comosus]